jgi:alkaline phosphatase
MKIRNLALAVLCLLIFVGIGLWAFRFGLNRKPFGVVLFLTDNFGPNTVSAARLYEGGSDHRLAVESMPGVAWIRNASAEHAVPDEAAAASAIATGTRVNNRALSVDPAGKPLATLVDLAKKRGRAVGIVTDGEIAGPGIAPFYARSAGGEPPADLAAQLAGHGGIDLVLGGGMAAFLPVSKGGVREDGRDLLIEARDRGVEVLRQKADLEQLPGFRGGPVLGLFATGRLPHRDEVSLRSTQPSLPDLVRHAIQSLGSRPGGYFLVVDAALPGLASHEKQGERALSAFLEFDQAVGVARRYAGENAVILAAGRTAIGGLALNGYPLRQDWGVALVGTNPLGYQSISWSGGEKPAEGSPAPAPHHASDMIAVGEGPGAGDLRGFLENRDLFGILAGQL